MLIYRQRAQMTFNLKLELQCRSTHTHDSGHTFSNLKLYSCTAKLEIELNWKANAE